jgi:hypothetical protein
LVSPLEDIVGLSQKFPDAYYFVEIKSDVFLCFSRERVYQICTDIVKQCSGQVVFISYDFEFVSLVKSHAIFLCGWVLSRFQESVLARAKTISPDFLIIDVNKLPSNELLPRGSWQWFVYDIVDPAEAQLWANLGASWIETWDIKKLKEARF